MLSPRRSAQLGLGAACLILVTSVYVLVAGASASNSNRNTSEMNLTASPAQTMPARGHTELVPVGVAQTLGMTARH